MDITLRPAQPKDATFLREVEAEAMADHAKALWGRYLPAEYPTLFDLENTRIVLLDGVAVGNLTLDVAVDHLRLRKLYLVPAAQGRGIGARLLRQVQDEARQLGLPLRLSVLRPNRRALAFYQREGMMIADETAERIFLIRPVAHVVAGAGASASGDAIRMGQG